MICRCGLRKQVIGAKEGARSLGGGRQRLRGGGLERKGREKGKGVLPGRTACWVLVLRALGWRF